MTYHLTRRELGGFVGSMFLLTACGAAKSHGAASSGSGSHSGASPPPGGGGQPVLFRGEVIPASAQIRVADARRYAAILAGTWLGGWHDSKGRSGTSDVTAHVDPRTRSATVDVSVTGDLLNEPLRAERYTVDLAGFRRTAASWHVLSPQVGAVTLAAGSGTDFTAMLSHLPQRTVDSVDAQATRVGSGRVDVNYTLHGAGAPVMGTMAWAKGSTRATPAPIGQTADATPANIQSGAYAAGLLRPADFTKTLGHAFGPTISNGGRLFYDTGVNVSDGLAKSTDGKYIVQYSVYLCDNAQHANAFWKKESAQGLPSLRGPWRDAYYLDSTQTLYAFDGRHVTQVQVLRTHPTPGRSPKSAEIAITKTLLRKLSS